MIQLLKGLADISIDHDIRLPKFCTIKGIKLKPLLTNLVGDTWQPEAVENLAHGPPDRQESFFAKVIGALRDAKAAGVVVDWEQIDPVYKKEITAFIDRFCDAMQHDDKELWLTVQ